MPVFEIQKDGKTFEVEAPDMNAAVSALGSAPPAPSDTPSQPTLQQSAQERFGLDPNIKRSALLPIGVNPEGKMEPAIPQLGVDLMESFMLPGHVLKGGKYTPQDAAKFTLDFTAPATSHRLAIGSRAPSLAKKEFIRRAPTTEDLLKKGGAGIEAAKKSGVTLKSDKYLDFLADVEGSVVKEGLDPMLHSKATAVVNAMAKRLGQDVDMGDLQTIRRQIGVAARSVAPELRDERRIAGIMQDKLDDMIDNLKPADLAAGSGDDALLAAKNLKEGRALWHQARKSEVIEGLVEKAQRQASGFENGLRTQFRSLLNNEKKLRGFSKEEIGLMKMIERGTPLQKALRFVGKLGPNRSGSAGLVGTAIGGGAGYATLGPAGAVGLPATGLAASTLAEKGTINLVDYLRAVAATGQTMPRRAGRIADMIGASTGPVAGTQMQEQ